MSVTALLNKLDRDAEMEELEARRMRLMKKQRKEQLRQEVQRLEKKYGTQDAKKKSIDSREWEKRGIKVTDARVSR